MRRSAAHVPFGLQRGCFPGCFRCGGYSKTAILMRCQWPCDARVGPSGGRESGCHLDGDLGRMWVCMESICKPYRRLHIVGIVEFV